MNSSRVVILVALLGVSAASAIVIRRWNAAGRASGSLADFPPLLERHVARAHLHGVPFKEAIPQLQNLAGVKIVVQWDAVEKRHVEPGHKIWLDFDDVPVAQLMNALTEQLRNYHQACGYGLQGDTIVLAPDRDLKRSWMIFDVADLERDIAPAERSDFGIALAARFCQEERYWSCGVVVLSQRCWLHEGATRLYVLQTTTAHQNLAEFLAALRQARPDGSGPSIARSRVLDQHSYTTVVRFYDVRDVSTAAKYSVPAVNAGETNSRPNWEASGILAVVYAIAHRGCDDSWCSPAQVCAVAGRLIVEQTPAGHEKVGQTLADMRAGKTIQWFRSTP